MSLLVVCVKETRQGPQKSTWCVLSMILHVLSAKLIFTSLPLNEARSSIGAPVVLEQQDLWFSWPPYKCYPPLLAFNQVRTKVNPPRDMPPPHEKCHPPMKSATPHERWHPPSLHCGVWRWWQQRSTLAFGAKSLVCFCRMNPNLLFFFGRRRLSILAGAFCPKYWIGINKIFLLFVLFSERFSTVSETLGATSPLKAWRTGPCGEWRCWTTPETMEHTYRRTINQEKWQGQNDSALCTKIFFIFSF